MCCNLHGIATTFNMTLAQLDGGDMEKSFGLSLTENKPFKLFGFIQRVCI